MSDLPSAGSFTAYLVATLLTFGVILSASLTHGQLLKSWFASVKERSIGIEKAVGYAAGYMTWIAIHFGLVPAMMAMLYERLFPGILSFVWGFIGLDVIILLVTVAILDPERRDTGSMV